MRFFYCNFTHPVDKAGLEALVIIDAKGVSFAVFMHECATEVYANPHDEGGCRETYCDWRPEDKAIIT